MGIAESGENTKTRMNISTMSKYINVMKQIEPVPTSAMHTGKQTKRNRKLFTPTKKLNLWWLLIVTKLSAAAAAIVLIDAHLLFWENDITYLSSIIFALWLLASIKTGFGIHQKKPANDSSWFIADAFLSIGMIGTVTGFVYMLSTTFINLNPEDANSMRAAIGTMATGMSTALLTTLAGLITSLSLKLQLIIQDE